MTSSMLIRLAAIFMFLAVALGAFGAHALETRLADSGHTETWKTAVHYHMIHALALFVMALMPQAPCWPARCFIGGILCFSGSLYALSLGAPRAVFGPITPLGGLAFLFGWSLLAFRRREFKSPR